MQENQYSVSSPVQLVARDSACSQIITLAVAARAHEIFEVHFILSGSAVGGAYNFKDMHSRSIRMKYSIQ